MHWLICNGYLTHIFHRLNFTWFYYNEYRLVWVYGVKRHFQKYFSYFVAVSFIGRGNRSTWRKYGFGFGSSKSSYGPMYPIPAG